MIPTPKQCLAILKAHHVPEHIIRHSQIVYQIASHLGRELNQKGAELNLPQIAAAALLHDIAKIGEDDHSRAGAELLTRLGYPEIAEIVRQHVILDQQKIEKIGEAEVVHYADKRVKHTTIVSVVERFNDLRARYGKTPEALAWLNQLQETTAAIEKRIFQKIGGDPQSISLLGQNLPTLDDNDSVYGENPR
ncbi:MAG: HD domain-containing protein [Thermodesulfobacteriota bacterium]